MADPIDELENMLEDAVENAGNAELLPLIYGAIDKLRHHWGGNRAYIAKRSQQRRYEEIVQLTESGLKPSEIAVRTGLSVSQVYRVKAKTSSYI
jgi:DNA-binding NarL/FixJ family response regulator